MGTYIILQKHAAWDCGLKMDDLRDLPLKALELSTRPRRALIQRLGIGTVGDLLKYTAHDLMRTWNFGERCLEEVREALAAHDLMLPGDGSERKLGRLERIEAKLDTIVTTLRAHGFSVERLNNRSSVISTNDDTPRRSGRR